MIRLPQRRVVILFVAGLKDGKELQFSFLHRTFLEYLAACSLKEQIQRSGNDAESVWLWISAKAWLTTWEEAILFLAGVVPDPVPLLTGLSDEKQDCFFRTRLCLATYLHLQCQATAATMPKT